MAKITHYGQWLDISSLNPVDKKNYLTSMTLFLFGAVAWGIHLSSVGIFYDTPDIENAKSSFSTSQTELQSSSTENFKNSFVEYKMINCRGHLVINSSKIRTSLLINFHNFNFNAISY